jgi:hypothetical protein
MAPTCPAFASPSDVRFQLKHAPPLEKVINVPSGSRRHSMANPLRLHPALPGYWLRLGDHPLGKGSAHALANDFSGCGDLCGDDPKHRTQNAKNPSKSITWGFALAERVGFEPTVPCGTPDFESGTFDHSATSPIRCTVVNGVDFDYSKFLSPLYGVMLALSCWARTGESLRSCVTTLVSAAWPSVSCLL